MWDRLKIHYFLELFNKYFNMAYFKHKALIQIFFIC